MSKAEVIKVKLADVSNKIKIRFIQFIKNNWQHFFTTITSIIILPLIFYCIMKSYGPKEPIPKIDHNPTDTYFNLIQITDLHFTYQSDRGTNIMNEFCKILPEVKPDGVIVTGDIGNKRVAGSFAPAHYIEEYSEYNKSVTACLETYPTLWYDIRGNHDADGVYGRSDVRNYAFSVLRGNAHMNEVGYVDIKRNNDTLRIIGLDTFGEAYLAFEAEGTIREESVERIVQYASDKNTYNILALHKTMNEVLTEKGQYLPDALLKVIKDPSHLNLTVCGHHHALEMSAYYKGFIQSKPKHIYSKAYNLLVFKNHVAYYGNQDFWNTPILPLCPSENVINCKHTEVYVGKHVDKVYITSLETNQTLELFTTDGRIWNSSEIIQGNVSVTVTVNNKNKTETFYFGQKYNESCNWKMYMRLSQTTIVLCFVAVILFVIRLLGGFLAKKVEWISKIAVFEHYSNIKSYMLLTGLILVVVLHYFPLLITHHEFISNGRKVVVFAGAYGAKIGDYYLPFYCHGYALYGGSILILWVNFWAAAHFRKHNYIRGFAGILLIMGTCVLEAYYLYLITSNALKFSPILYLSILSFVANMILALYTVYRQGHPKQPTPEEIDIYENISFEKLS